MAIPGNRNHEGTIACHWRFCKEFVESIQKQPILMHTWNRARLSDFMSSISPGAGCDNASQTIGIIRPHMFHVWSVSGLRDSCVHAYRDLFEYKFCVITFSSMSHVFTSTISLHLTKGCIRCWNAEKPLVGQWPRSLDTAQPIRKEDH